MAAEWTQHRLRRCYRINAMAVAYSGDISVTITARTSYGIAPGSFEIGGGFKATTSLQHFDGEVPDELSRLKIRETS